MQRCCFPPALFCIHSWRSTGGRQQLARCPPPPGGALALASFYTGSDHHLTTPSSQPVPFIVFYVPTFFYNHHKQRRKLCTLHNFRRWFMLFACASQFSDPKGRRFESCQPHQESTRLRYVGACFFCCMESVPARAALQPHHFAQLFLGFPLLFVKGMGINVQRRTGLGVAQQTGYRAHVHALGDQ